MQKVLCKLHVLYITLSKKLRRWKHDENKRTNCCERRKRKTCSKLRNRFWYAEPWFIVRHSPELLKKLKEKLTCSRTTKKLMVLETAVIITCQNMISILFQSITYMKYFCLFEPVVATWMLKSSIFYLCQSQEFFSCFKVKYNE